MTQWTPLDPCVIDEALIAATPPTRCIYRITNALNGRSYIGSSGDTPQRWSNHRMQLRKGNHHSKWLQREWNKYGAYEFVFNAIEAVPEGADLLQREREHIASRHPEFNSFEVDPDRSRFKHNNETRRRMSEAQKQRHARERAAGLSFKSPETRARIAAAHIGMKPSEATRKKLREAALRRCAEGRNQQFARGRKMPQAAIDAGAAKRRGRKRPEHEKVKIAAGLRRAYEEGRRALPMPESAAYARSFIGKPKRESIS